MLNSIQISELLCTKLCHDLAGPTGAINNGIDFFDSENKQMHDKALELVKLSSKQAVNRLTFYRQAYGTVSEDTEMHFAELETLATKYIEDTKLSLDFNAIMENDSDAINARIGKILLNIIVIAGGIMMNNGLITIKIKELADTILLSIDSNSTSFRMEDELKDILSYNLGEIVINSRNIQQYYTSLLIKESNGNTKITEYADKISISITCDKHFGR